MSDTDLVKLYSQQILRLAASIPNTARLNDADASASCRAPLCGSVVTADVRMADGRVVAFGQDVKACALGQAAASVVGSNVVGRTRDEIATGRDQLARMLSGEDPAPEPPFDGLEVLRPARDFRNRHASILLAFDATLAAMDAVADANCA